MSRKNYLKESLFLVLHKEITHQTVFRHGVHAVAENTMELRVGLKVTLQ
ncbi:MAG: hypothetical protein WDZ27_06895 [Waddliaceae bacterium]